MTDVRVVLVTAPDEETACSIGQTLIDERLAACVNLLPTVRSLYRWKGEMCDDREVLMVIKTSAARAAELAERVTELHPYEVAEVLTIGVEAGAVPYLEWVREETISAEGA